MLQDESFGIVPLSRAHGKWEVFLIQHQRGRYWGFPKGHAELGETPQEAALRELKEETNLELVQFLQHAPLMEQYSFLIDGRRVYKRVSYFAAEVKGKVKLQVKEIQNGVWLPLAQAYEQVTHPEGKLILSQVEKILPKI